jgi:hypothetical protein
VALQRQMAVGTLPLPKLSAEFATQCTPRESYRERGVRICNWE